MEELRAQAINLSPMSSLPAHLRTPVGTEAPARVPSPVLCTMVNDGYDLVQQTLDFANGLKTDNSELNRQLTEAIDSNILLSKTNEHLHMTSRHWWVALAASWRVAIALRWKLEETQCNLDKVLEVKREERTKQMAFTTLQRSEAKLEMLKQRLFLAHRCFLHRQKQ
eukprot:TRINITY_DN67017_c4_g1_i2.p1 TRINITY_DN67017_c4_g1~~TRINITY_DN67017_c4_g1_i2.p1  ORF type:complete len:167 (-),score=17.39 TRINITY_DN67017_c4_g1_i2:604-1104(-)